MAGPQILVVEDNEKEATTGGQAVELAIAHSPDLVLIRWRVRNSPQLDSA